jgi:hypothetical protein
MVDGFTNSLNCEAVNLSLIYALPPIRYLPDGHVTNLRLRLRVAPQHPKFLVPAGVKHTRRVTYPLAYCTRLAMSQCNGTSDDSGKQFLILLGLMNYAEECSSKFNDMSGAEYPMGWSGEMRVWPGWGIWWMARAFLNDPRSSTPFKPVILSIFTKNDIGFN